ncbi:TIC 100 [Olea europaea subsp. europaea]|uniref:TIC 100 n=1 Tax=Olea europaea subsp. europaea TaxID=158383 RepID=A0A8S0V2P2_OLEEU|nr:TIC 100 [Olea europaea subsp. europaea]
MSNEEETHLELKTPEDESESDSDSDDEPLSYSRPRGTAQETGPDDSDSENTAESNSRCFTKVLNSKRLRKEREAEEEDYVYHEDLFNFPKDPENWREEDWKELRGDAPICHCRLLLSFGVVVTKTNSMLSQMHPGIAEVAAAKAWMFVNKPDGRRKANIDMLVNGSMGECMVVGQRAYNIFKNMKQAKVVSS